MGFKNIKHSRALGQNFFTNTNLAEKIVKEVLEYNPDTILEIGGGTGIFTELFYKKNINPICIEKDRVLAENLEKNYPKAKVIQRDILELDIHSLLPKGKKNISFGSLPYNQAKKIIHTLIQSQEIQHHFYIIQKEVAEKYLGKDKSSKLSCCTQLYATPKILFDISPNNFKPKPKVTSSFIHFQRHKKYKHIKNEEDFIKYLDQAFKQPRRKLKNNLKIKDTRLIPNTRPEELNLEEHLEIWEKLKTK